MFQKVRNCLCNGGKWVLVRFGWLPPLVQTLLDYFHDGRKCLVDCIAYLSIRFFGIENRTFLEVQKQISNKQRYKELELDDTSDVDTLLTLARESYKAAQDRRTVVTDKCKTMQTLSAFLLTIIGVLLPKAFDFEWTWMRIVFYVAALLLMNAVTLLLVYLAVGAETVIKLDQEKARMAGAVLKRGLINTYGRCTVATDNRTDYLVDIYKVSRFYFMFAFTLVVVLFSISYFRHTSATDADKIIQQLRGDPQLIALLKGPQGIGGPKGDKGDSLLSDATIPAVTRFGQKEQSAAIILSMLWDYSEIFQFLPDNKTALPVSDYLFRLLRGPLRSIEPDDRRFGKLFDRFEYLSAICFGDTLNTAEMPIGRFGRQWRHPEAGNIMETIDAEMKNTGKNWLPLQSGVCGGSWDRFVERKRQLDEAIKSSRTA